MGRRKKESTIKSTSGFSNPSDLSLEELISISLTSLQTINESFLSNLNWNQGALGIICLSLSADNQNVASGNLVLLGNLFDSKSVNANHFWTCSSPTTLTIKLPDLTIFSFPDGSLVSNYVQSSDFSYHFTRNSSIIQQTDLISESLSDFCLRAFIYPTSDSYARILVLLYPATEDSLANFPLYADSRFPGIKFCDYEFPLAPAGPVSPLGRFWGFPLVPAIFPCSDWTADSLLPSGLCLRSAMSSILRSAVLPDSSTLAGYRKKLEDLLTSGSFSSNSKLPALLWPQICAPNAPDLPSTVEHEDSGESSDDLSTTGINPTATLAQVHSELEQFTRNNTAGNSYSSSYLDPIPGPSNPVRSQSARLITTETLEHMDLESENPSLPRTRNTLSIPNTFRTTRPTHTRIERNTRELPQPGDVPTVTTGNRVNRLVTTVVQADLDSDIAEVSTNLNTGPTINLEPHRPNPTKKRKKKDKKRKNKKKKSSSSSNSSSNSSSSTSSSSDDSDDESNWSMMRSIWPLEKRPLALQQKDSFNRMNLEHLISLARLDKDNTKGIKNDFSASFSKDKKPRSSKFKADKDDCFKHLHEARFLRYPLGDMKKWWRKVPRTRTHIFKNLPLQFSGANNKISPKTIQLLHDRTEILTFKMFHTGNVNVSSKPIKRVEKREEDGVHSTLDFNWEAPTSLSQVTDALHNYCSVLQFLWPYDPTGIILMRIINKYNFFSAAHSLSERVNLVSTFFNAVLRENAARASRKELIMSFSEQEECIKSVLTSAGLNNSVPAGRSFNIEQQKLKFQQSRPIYNAGAPSSSSNTTSSTIPNKSKVVLHNGIPICFAFNNGSCKNTRSSTGCKDSRNRDLAHVCNKFLDKSNSHCLEKHSRNNHR